MDNAWKTRYIYLPVFVHVFAISEGFVFFPGGKFRATGHIVRKDYLIGVHFLEKIGRQPTKSQLS